MSFRDIVVIFIQPPEKCSVITIADLLRNNNTILMNERSRQKNHTGMTKNFTTTTTITTPTTPAIKTMRNSDIGNFCSI